MDPTDITPVLEKVEFKCGAAIPEPVRASVYESFRHVLRQYPEIARLYVEVGDPEATDHGVVFLAKGTVELGGPDIHTSVFGEQVQTAIDFLLENVTRQLRRQRRFKPAEKNSGSILPSLPAA
jgi:ribosome-associated translation inhibitor RaiA